MTKVSSILLVAVSAVALLLTMTPATAIGILSPSDDIIAIDLDPPIGNSNFPGAESPDKLIDGGSLFEGGPAIIDVANGDPTTKYLNFAGAGSGFIVTPSELTVIKSFQFKTANDASDRDPASFELFGTNDPVTSMQNSTGLAGTEVWTPIAGFDLNGAFDLPSGRREFGPVVPIINSDPFSSYKMVFPTNKGAGIFQLSEALFFESNDGTGVDFLDPGDSIIAIQVGPDSRFPGGESPANAIDGNGGTKYLNFGKENSGFIVTPATGPSIVRTFQITTANDFESRDPASYQLYGTNDAVQSGENSRADGGEVWTLIDSGSIDMPVERNVPGPYVTFENSTAYTSYQMVFPTLRDTNAERTDSLQYSEVQFYTTVIPEPTSLALIGLALSTVTLVLGVACLTTPRREPRVIVFLSMQAGVPGAPACVEYCHAYFAANQRLKNSPRMIHPTLLTRAPDMSQPAVDRRAFLAASAAMAAAGAGRNQRRGRGRQRPDPDRLYRCGGASPNAPRLGHPPAA